METTCIKVGLDAIGLQDNQHLKSALMNCDEPLKAIADFQDENSILLPTLKPALPLLDLHNVKRLDFHQSIADELKERLVKRVELLAASKEPTDLGVLEELLDKSFPVINISRITNVVMLIMKNLPNINIEYLNYIKEKPEYYSIAPIEVKRQIWIHDTDLFTKELQPMFENCLTHYDEQLLDFEENTDKDQTIFFKYKKQSNYVNEIVKMIGNNGKLYSSAVNSLLYNYLNTKNCFYASIRSLLLMKLHDVNLVDVSTSENLYKFTWTLNACIKERKIDAKRIKEIEAIMDSKKFDKVLKDASFILADCFAIDTLAHNAIALLTKCLQTDNLPRDCSELVFVLRLLTLSTNSWDLLTTEHSVKEAKLDPMIITHFLTNLTYLISDYQERLCEESLKILNLHQFNVHDEYGSMNMQFDTNSSGNAVSTATSNRNDTKMNYETITANLVNLAKQTMATYEYVSDGSKVTDERNEVLEAIRTSNDTTDVCAVLVIYFIIECIELNDWLTLKFLLPILRIPKNNPNFEKWFLYQFISNICECTDEFKHEWFVKMIFDEFLLKFLKNDFQYEIVYKLIDKIYQQIPSSVFTHLLEEVKPKKISSNTVHMTYSKLKLKFDDIKTEIKTESNNSSLIFISPKV